MIFSNLYLFSIYAAKIGSREERVPLTENVKEELGTYKIGGSG